jgi:predicted AlkP superfamily phosphohydrolase/phosphomutase
MGNATKKLLILALDSVNREALQPHLDAGRMPNLARLVGHGLSGVLQSTTPAHTAPAWTTLATGKHPGVHGVMNFRRFDPRTQQSRLNTTQDVAHKTVWQLLDEAGLNVGVVSQPESYPVRELKHGFAVTGLETPSTHCDFTWPPALKAEILAKLPDFCFRSEHVRDKSLGKDWDSWDDFSGGMDALTAENERAHALNLYLAQERPWDVLFLYYQATDALFHKAWRWCDPETCDEDRPRATRIGEFFARLDEMLGEILALPQAQDALVLVCSDHGHGPVHQLVRVNNLLASLDFLRRAGLITQVKGGWEKLSGQRRAKGLGIGVAWHRTHAYMPFEAIAGFIYLNRKGREPTGIVEDNAVAELIQEVRAGLLQETSPETGNPLFDAVTTPAEVYPTCGAFDFPELYVLPARGVNLVRKLSYGWAVEIPREKQRGTHRPEGFFALYGPTVARDADPAAPSLRPNLSDLAPTILAALGQPVPSDMTGRALTGLFLDRLDVKSGPPSVLGPAPGGAGVYSDAENAIVEQRLADLGYVD